MQASKNSLSVLVLFLKFGNAPPTIFNTLNIPPKTRVKIPSFNPSSYFVETEIIDIIAPTARNVVFK